MPSSSSSSYWSPVIRSRSSSFASAHRLFASVSLTSAVAAALAGMPFSSSLSSGGSAPLLSAEASAAQPASATWVPSRKSSVSCVSPPVGDDGALAGGGGGGGGATTTSRAAIPSSPSGLSLRLRVSSAGSCRKAGARATSPASLMAAWHRKSALSCGRAPRPRAAANAEAPASPTCMLTIARVVTAGNEPASSPAASCSTPSGPAALPLRYSFSSAGSTAPSVPSVVRSAAERALR
eukprot:scaffold25511_cov60-Phaeocystis_antarctica.AAC.4